eukprot:m.121753 g.121753  ORF g.121753 m.121753 type:complete len:256 (+) comp14404_c1_seq7:130-897(+)
MSVVSKPSPDICSPILNCYQSPQSPQECHGDNPNDQYVPPRKLSAENPSPASTNSAALVIHNKQNRGNQPCLIVKHLFLIEKNFSNETRQVSKQIVTNNPNMTAQQVASLIYDIFSTKEPLTKSLFENYNKKRIGELMRLNLVVLENEDCFIVELLPEYSRFSNAQVLEDKARVQHKFFNMLKGLGIHARPCVSRDAVKKALEYRSDVVENKRKELEYWKTIESKNEKRNNDLKKRMEKMDMESGTGDSEECVRR